MSQYQPTSSVDVHSLLFTFAPASIYAFSIREHQATPSLRASANLITTKYTFIFQALHLKMSHYLAIVFYKMPFVHSYLTNQATHLSIHLLFSISNVSSFHILFLSSPTLHLLTPENLSRFPIFYKTHVRLILKFKNGAQETQ